MRCLPRLRELDLSANELGPGAPEYLVVSYNELGRIPFEAPSATATVRHLDLSYNRLTSRWLEAFLDHTDLGSLAPVAGRAAVFRHEGEAVGSGTKYALRTDVLYEADEDIVLTYEE